MKSDMPILYQNIMFGMKSDLGRDAFLWATDRPGDDRMCYRAERFAHEVENMVAKMTPMLDAATRICTASGISDRDTHDPDLMNLILKRHANWRFGGNVAPTYGVLDPVQLPRA